LEYFLGILFPEIYFRFYNPQRVYSLVLATGANCYKSDHTLFAVLKPNTTCFYNSKEYKTTVRINNLGMRSSNDQLLEKKQEKTRILFLGDSYTFGQGVENDESYPEVVGRILNQQKLDVEVMNAGIPGSEILYDYLYMKEKITMLKPDIIVVGFFLGNDLSDLDYFHGVDLDSDGLPTRRVTSIFLTERLFGIKIPNTESIVNTSPCLIKPDCYDFDDNIKQTERLIFAMNSLAQKSNILFMVVLIPSELQLPKNIIRNSGINIFVSEKNRHYLINKFADFLKDNKITILIY
jgi:lysophospholipase L1-like esterase